MSELSWSSLWNVIVTSGVFIAIFYLIFLHLESIDILRSWIWKLVCWITRSVKLGAVSAEIQAKINSAAERVEQDTRDLLPYPLRIHWITTGEEFAKLEDQVIAVRLRNELDDARNLVAVTTLYVQSGFMQQSRVYIADTLMRALDIKMTWRLLSTTVDTDCGRFFLSEVRQRAISDDNSDPSTVVKVDDIDNQGLLTRILLRELRFVGPKQKGRLPSPDIWSETTEFLNFVHTMVVSGRGEQYPLNFLGKTIKVSLQPVARIETVASSGLRVHKRWLRHKTEIGIETIYILGIGDRNIDLATHLAQWAKDEALIEIARRQEFNTPSYSGRPTRSVVITCHSRASASDLTLDDEEEVSVVLAQQIPDIATGEIQVMDIARERDRRTIILIRSLSPNKDPVRVTRSHLGKVRAAIGGEQVFFALWSDEVSELVANCLALERSDVLDIKIDLSGRTADVLVVDSRAAARAIGSNGVGARLAEGITGLAIRIRSMDDDEDGKSVSIGATPEDDLVAILKRHIPEVANGDIEISRLIREPGVQSMILVKNNRDSRNPVSVCVGPHKTHLHSIIAELDEKVWLIAADKNREDVLVRCLGIKPTDLIEASIDELAKTASVLVTNSRACARAIGESGITVRQAAALLGLRYVKVMCPEDDENRRHKAHVR